MFHGAEARITGTKIQGSGVPPQAGKRANQAGKAKMTGRPSNRAWLLTSQDSRAGHPRSGYTKQVRARPAKQPKQQESEPSKSRPARSATSSQASRASPARQVPPKQPSSQARPATSPASPAKAAQQPGKTSQTRPASRARQATTKAGRRYFFRWPLWSLQRP